MLLHFGEPLHLELPFLLRLLLLEPEQHLPLEPILLSLDLPHRNAAPRDLLLVVEAGQSVDGLFVFLLDLVLVVQVRKLLREGRVQQLAELPQVQLGV